MTSYRRIRCEHTPHYVEKFWCQFQIWIILLLRVWIFWTVGTKLLSPIKWGKRLSIYLIDSVELAHDSRHSWFSIQDNKGSDQDHRKPKATNGDSYKETVEKRVLGLPNIVRKRSGRNSGFDARSHCWVLPGQNVTRIGTTVAHL